MKDDLKMFGAEALYLSASVIVAGLASLLQTVGRTFEGRYSGFFMSGDEYSYSILFYLLGMVIFVSFMVMGYRYFLRKRISNLYRTGMSAKIFSLAFMIFVELIESNA